MDNIGNKIADLRKKADMSQTQLAEKLNVSNKTVSKWECGKSVPDIEMLSKISKLFNISIDSIVTEEIKPNSNVSNENTNTNKSKSLSNKTIKIILFSTIGFVLICITLLCVFLIPRKPIIRGSKLFDINNETLTLSCTVDNSNEQFSFYDTVDLPFNTRYKIYYDLIGNNELVSGTTPLHEGNNTFYMVVENSIGEKNTYTVVIRRRPTYKVTFDLCYDNEIYYQFIEEDQYAGEYTPKNRLGYTFSGWDYDFSKPITGNITIAANWTPNKTLVNFNVNGGTEQLDSVLVNYGTPYNFCVPTKLGNDFIGWEYNNTLITNEYGKSYGNLTFIEPVTLIAKWKPTDYVIDYYNVDGATNNNPLIYNISEQALILIEAKKIGYTFNGWYSDNNLTHRITEIPAGKTGHIKLYADWSINSYIIQFDSNGGSVTDPIESDYAGRITAPTPPTKNGFIFSGWYTDNSFSSLFIFNTMPAESLTLVAKWKSRSGQVDSNGYIEIWDTDYFVHLTQNSNMWTKNYKLYADIDLSGTPINTIGTKTNPFTGHFDGDYHKISNLSFNSVIFNEITQSESENSFISYMGLFGFCSGELENIYIDNATFDISYNIENSKDYYHLYLGILCGYAQNAIIHNISVNGSINLITDITWIEVGGAIGYTKSCTIYASKAEVVIETNKTTTDRQYSNGSICIGGFIGRDCYYTDGKQTQISNCYSIGAIDCSVTENTFSYIGGFLGGAMNNTLIISNCYSKCDIISKNCSNVSYFTSASGSNVIVNNCYWLSGANSTKEKNLMNRQWVIDNLGWQECDIDKVNEGYVWILSDGALPKFYWEE